LSSPSEIEEYSIKPIMSSAVKLNPDFKILNL